MRSDTSNKLMEGAFGLVDPKRDRRERIGPLVGRAVARLIRDSDHMED